MLSLAKLRSNVLTVAGLTFLTLLGSPALAQEEDLPNVMVLATGGTIAGTASEATATSGYSIERSVQELLDAVPDLVTIANISSEQVYNVGSPQVTEVERIVLSKRINALLAQDDIDGIVVTHGTETLEQTAYFLNLTVKSDKPVVVVGAMRPGSALSADGPMNLFNAVKVAGALEAVDKGVLIMMNDRIGSARFINKTSGWAVETFDSLEQGFLGDVVRGTVRFYQSPLLLHTNETELDVSEVDSLPLVHILYGNYGPITKELVEAAITDGAKGVVIAGPMSGDGGDRLEELAAAGDLVVVRSFWQASGLRDRNDPFLGSNSLTPLKTRVLLQIALNQTDDLDTIQRYLDTY